MSGLAQEPLVRAVATRAVDVVPGDLQFDGPGIG